MAGATYTPSVLHCLVSPAKMDFCSLLVELNDEIECAFSCVAPIMRRDFMRQKSCVGHVLKCRQRQRMAGRRWNDGQSQMSSRPDIGFCVRKSPKGLSSPRARTSSAREEELHKGKGSQLRDLTCLFPLGHPLHYSSITMPQTELQRPRSDTSSGDSAHPTVVDGGVDERIKSQSGEEQLQNASSTAIAPGGEQLTGAEHKLSKGRKYFLLFCFSLALVSLHMRECARLTRKFTDICTYTGAFLLIPQVAEDLDIKYGSTTWIAVSGCWFLQSRPDAPDRIYCHFCSLVACMGPSGGSLFGQAGLHRWVLWRGTVQSHPEFHDRSVSASGDSHWLATDMSRYAYYVMRALAGVFAAATVSSSAPDCACAHGADSCRVPTDSRRVRACGTHGRTHPLWSVWRRGQLHRRVSRGYRINSSSLRIYYCRPLRLHHRPRSERRLAMVLPLLGHHRVSVVRTGPSSARLSLQCPLHAPRSSSFRTPVAP